MTTTSTSHPDVSSWLDAIPIGSFQIRVAALCSLVAILDGFDIQAVAFVASTLSESWQVPIANFGPVLAASLFGLMVGALVLSPLGDRFGRKPVLVICFAAVGVFTFATAFAESMTSLWVCRFLTGLGLGGTIPNAISLTAEFAPARRRTVMVTVMFCGFPLGAAFGGFLADRLITDFGWQSIFYVGGLMPLALCLLLLWLLPESVRFLASKSTNDPRLEPILRKIAHDPPPLATGSSESGKTAVQPPTVAALFQSGRWPITLLIWTIFFGNLLILYFLLSWLPGILSEAGLPRDRAFIATGLFNLGGVFGGVVLAFACDRFGVFRVMIPVLAVTSAGIAAIAAWFDQLQLVLFFVFVAGVGVIGSQFFLNVIAAAYYPTAIRTTGLGWALGVGRAGAVIAPLIGGVLVGWQWQASSMFWLLALLTLGCSGVLWVLDQRLRPARA